MRSLLPFILLACPVMMMFMMRGMHGGGRSSADSKQDDKQLGHAGHDMHMGQAGAGRPDLPTPDERISQLERELAQLRDVKDRQQDHHA